MTNIAIIGATGNVGRKTLEVIEKKDIKFDNLFLVASSNSAGKKISFKGKDYEVHDLKKYDWQKPHQPNLTGTDSAYHPNKNKNAIKKKYKTWKN